MNEGCSLFVPIGTHAIFVGIASKDGVLGNYDTAYLVFTRHFLLDGNAAAGLPQSVTVELCSFLSRTLTSPCQNSVE